MITITFLSYFMSLVLSQLSDDYANNDDVSLCYLNLSCLDDTFYEDISYTVNCCLNEWQYIALTKFKICCLSDKSFQLFLSFFNRVILIDREQLLQRSATKFSMRRFILNVLLKFKFELSQLLLSQKLSLLSRTFYQERWREQQSQKHLKSKLKHLKLHTTQKARLLWSFLSQRILHLLLQFLQVLMIWSYHRNWWFWELLLTYQLWWSL